MTQCVMTRHKWAAPAGVWMAVWAVSWGLWWGDRPARLEAARRKAAFQATIERLNQPLPPKAADAGAAKAPPRPAVDRARLLRDLEALSFDRSEAKALSRARGYIAHELTAHGYAPEMAAFSGGINVLAERIGTDPAQGAVLIGAHYDTVWKTPGTDDNATGVAVVLEAARYFAERPTPRTLRFAFFDAEEAGLQGSRRYAADDLRVADLKAVLIVEMVGFACHTEGCQRAPKALDPRLVPKVGDFLAVLGDLEHLEILEAFREAAAHLGKPRLRVLPVPERGIWLPDTRRSDHVPFWDRGIGAAMVSDTGDLRNPHYHQPTDTLETIDRVFFGDSAALVIEATARLLVSGRNR